MPGVAPETEFATLGFWPDEAVKRLRNCWITTAEQVVAAAATPDGVIALVEQTGLAKSELLRLLSLTRATLSPDVRRELSQPADTSLYGTGALAPPLKNQQ
jgi:hypothetical protein